LEGVAVPLRDFGAIEYVPLLGLKPAEMRALEELPARTKGVMMPLVPLGTWSSAHHLSSSISRIEAAYGDRPIFISLADARLPADIKPVHRELEALRSSSDGYSAWCSFIADKSNYVPALQISDQAQIASQFGRLDALGRGVMILLEREFLDRVGSLGIQTICDLIGPAVRRQEGIIFLLDFGNFGWDQLYLQSKAAEFACTIFSRFPQSHVALSASSFPESFTGLESQSIVERQVFSSVRESLSGRLIYSDRGSARPESQRGGGGAPNPRIDYANKAAWQFFRAGDPTDRAAAFFEQARLAMNSPAWDPAMRIWGTQMIERTALGDASAIASAATSTAARINIHLHHQTFYSSDRDLYDTDDDWID
jgi:hypothetical protein